MDIEIVKITESLAGICMAICQIPQAWFVYKTKRTDGISITMQIILTFGIGMWFVSGILIPDTPMLLSNGFCLVFCLYILYMCIYNKFHNRK